MSYYLFQKYHSKTSTKTLKKYFFSYHSRFSHQLYRNVLLMFSLSPFKLYLSSPLTPTHSCLQSFLK